MLAKYRQQKKARHSLRMKIKRKLAKLYSAGHLTLSLMRKMVPESKGEKRVVLRRLVAGTMGKTILV